MQRLIVVLLAAIDALVAAAVGLAALLAPLTLLWTLAFGIDAAWGALWPAAATVWQFGHGVPVTIALDNEAVRALGIAPDAASFVLSLAPLTLAAITLISGARSGRRAAKSGAGLTGVIAGFAAFMMISVLVALTSMLEVASTPFWLAIALPPLIYLVGALGAAFSYAWQEGDNGWVDRLRDRLDASEQWGHLPEHAVRGAVTVVVALVGASGVLLALSTLLRGGEVVALFEALRVDALGATIITFGHFAYLPTMLGWGIAWMAGPGFAVGSGTSLSPVGAQLGVVPGIPAFGLLPDDGSVWMLVIVLVPVAAGAFAGWIVRSRLFSAETELDLLPRLAMAASIAALTAGAGALIAMLSSGSIGPGRLEHVGPQPGAVALALGVEVFIGAAILLISPRHGADNISNLAWYDAEYGRAEREPEEPSHT